MKPISEHYKEWICRWETRLAERDKNRVVRPLRLGIGMVERLAAAKVRASVF